MNELFGQPYILSVSSLQDFFFSSGKILASPDSPLVSRIAFCFEIFFLKPILPTFRSLPLIVILPNVNF